MIKDYEKLFKEAFMSKRNIEKFATDFSEGDEFLAETLLNLWKNNIMTLSCCKGHDTKEYYMPSYLSILIDENSIDLIENLYNKLCSEKKDVSFVISNRYENNLDSFIIYMRGDSKEYTLNLINQYIGIKSNLNNKVIDNSLFMLEYAKKMSYKYEIEITKSNTFIQFRSQNDNSDYIDFKPLDECITSLNNIDDISHLFIECNEDELDIIMDVLNKKNKQI